MDGYGIDNIDEGFVLVIVKSALDSLLDDNNDVQPLPKETRDAVRCEIARGPQSTFYEATTNLTKY